jgi:hypothetical protein
MIVLAESVKGLNGKTRLGVRIAARARVIMIEMKAGFETTGEKFVRDLSIRLAFHNFSVGNLFIQGSTTKMYVSSFGILLVRHTTSEV